MIFLVLSRHHSRPPAQRIDHRGRPSPVVRSRVDRNRPRESPRVAAAPRAYWISTTAPAASSCCLIFAASSLETFSFRVLPPASTRSFASFRPRPVMARTSLMTGIFLASSKLFRTTVNSVFSSAAGPAAAARARRHGHGGRRGDAELLLHRLDELGDLEDRHRGDRVENLFLCECCHLSSPSCVCCVASGVRSWRRVAATRLADASEDWYR